MSRIRNADISGIPSYDIDESKNPWFWHGSKVLDGTVLPWSSAPLSSLYLYRVAGSVTMYVKIASASATADWVTLAHTGGGQTISGNLTVTGKVTASDLEATTRKVSVPETRSMKESKK